MQLFKTLIDYPEAISLVLENTPRLPVACVPLMEARELALSEDIRARFDSPPFDNSAVDGYAVRSADAEVGRIFKVVDEAPAGRRAQESRGGGPEPPRRRRGRPRGRPHPARRHGGGGARDRTGGDPGLRGTLSLPETGGRHPLDRQRARRAGDACPLARRDLRLKLLRPARPGPRSRRRRQSYGRRLRRCGRSARHDGGGFDECGRRGHERWGLGGTEGPRKEHTT